MIESSISKRYAKALFKVALDEGAQGAYLKYLEIFDKVLYENKDIIPTLANRFVDINSRYAVVDEMVKKVGAPVFVANFFKILIKKRRIELFDGIVRAFKTYVFESENKLEAIITTAKELEETRYNELEQLFSSVTGKRIVATREVKPDVLGGIAVRLGGEIYDGTIRARLNQLCKSLRKET